MNVLINIFAQWMVCTCVYMRPSGPLDLRLWRMLLYRAQKSVCIYIYAYIHICTSIYFIYA